MNFYRWGLSELTTIDITNVDKDRVLKLLYASNGGTVFVLWRKQLFGYYNIDFFEKWNGEEDVVKYLNENCPQIIDSDSFGTLNEQILRIITKNIYAGQIAVVNENKELIGAISYTDDTWLKDRENALSYLCLSTQNRIDFSKYFIEKKYYKIAFWGVNKVSLSFASYLLQSFVSNLITVYGVYDNKKTKINCKENLLNYPCDVYFINSLDELPEIDLLIVCDWRFRHLQNIMPKKKVIYFNVLFNSNDFKKVINYTLKQKLFDEGYEVYTVRIPTKEDLGIQAKPEMNKNDRLEWFSKQTLFSKESEDMVDFNCSRQEFAKNEMKHNGLCYFGDYRSKYVNNINKQRVVLNAPASYKNKIYLIGPCMVSGLFNKDDQTIGFYLQGFFNMNNMEYLVCPIGIPNDADRYYDYKMIKSLDIKEGDVIYWIEQTFRMDKFDIDLIDVFKTAYKEYGDDFYYDIVAHSGKYIMENSAKKIFEHYLSNSQIIKEKNEIIINNSEVCEKQEPNYLGNIELQNYKKKILQLSKFKMPIIGAIVMNCNPFTNGHRYLIEYAINNVDYLYIFVVEEDKSFFKFKDRIALVKEGVKNIKNVQVLPSGQFIISSNTFSEYFDKANLKGTTIDTTLDVEIFATQIAPTLNITVRFAGEEPLDPITRQYNQSMKTILPKYGIDFVEIPRKEIDNNVISASRVRLALEEKNWEEIKKIVPKTTYDFLYNNYC